MSDFYAMIRETFSGSPGLPPGLDAVSLDERVAALDTRMRTVNSVTWLGALVMLGVAILGLVLLLGADAGTEVKWLVFYGVLIVWAVMAIAMVKLWHFNMQAETAAMKEILRNQAMLQARPQS